MPPFAYFVAKVVVSMIFSTVIVLALFGLGFTFGGVRLPTADFAKVLGTLAIGSLPFSAMGLAVGYFTPYPVGFFITTFAFGTYVLVRGGRFVFDRRGRRKRALSQPSNVGGEA